MGEHLPEGTRVVVVRGDGPSFSAGIDLRAFTPEGIDGETVFADIAALDDAEAAERIAQAQSAFRWWRDRDDVVTVAAVRGAAVGAGFQLALACDLRVCADDARFAMRETTLGIVPDLTGTHNLVRLVGYSRALEICATGRWVPVEEAAALGLANLVVGPDVLDAAVHDLVGTLLAAPAAAVSATKALLRQAVDTPADTARRAERETQVGLIRALVGRT